MTFKRFEDLEIWQEARLLAKLVHELLQSPSLHRDFALRDQMSRSSGSVMDNIAEGFDAGGNPEFIRFLGYSRRSCSELQSQMYRVKDQGHCDEQQFQALHDRAAMLRSQIGGFIRYLGSKRDFWSVKERVSTNPNQE